MLIRTFPHVHVQLSELGNRQTLNSFLKHRLAPPTPSISPPACPGYYQRILERKLPQCYDQLMTERKR